MFDKRSFMPRRSIRYVETLSKNPPHRRSKSSVTTSLEQEKYSREVSWKKAAKAIDKKNQAHLHDTVSISLMAILYMYLNLNNYFGLKASLAPRLL